MAEDLAFASAASLIELYRAKQVSPVEVAAENLAPARNVRERSQRLCAL